MLDLLFKDFGPIWLLGLFPLMFVMIVSRTKRIRKVWGNPDEEACFACFPRSVAQDPKHCHRYFVALVVGVSLLAWVVIAGPLVAVLHNHIYDQDINPSLGAADKMMGRFLPLFITLWISFWLGPLLIIYGYSSALLRGYKIGFYDTSRLPRSSTGSNDSE